jgi:hypothetical protein
MGHLIAHPLAIASVLLLLCALLLRFLPLRGRAITRAFWIAVLLLLAAGITGPVFCVKGHMLNLDEPTVISVAAAAVHGQPLYTSPNSGEYYSLLYGPVAYWVYWPPMLAHATDLRLFQLWPIIPLLGSGLIAIRLARRSGDWTGMAFALLPYAATVVMQSVHEWAMKGDPWLLLFLGAQLLAALELSAIGAVIVVAACAALAIDTKVTVLVLTFVPLIILQRRFGTAKALMTAMLAAGLTVAPFLLPTVSLKNFLYYLMSSTHHGVRPLFVKVNGELMLFMALPVLVLALLLFFEDRGATLQRLRQRSLTVVAILACVTAVLTSAKRGAGAWHLAPLAPMFTWLTAALWRRMRTSPAKVLNWTISRALLGSVAVSQLLLSAAALASSIAEHRKGIPLYESTPGRLVARDLIAIMRSHSGATIEMGYGALRSYEMTWQRPVLVMAGNPYTLDADAMDEAAMSHKPLPAAVLGELRSCRVQIYLIPKGEEPFSLESNYFIYGNPAARDLFPLAFQEEFERDYRKSGTSRYFDLWQCMPKS